jgi:hypothetical protein
MVEAGFYSFPSPKSICGQILSCMSDHHGRIQTNGICRVFHRLRGAACQCLKLTGLRPLAVPPASILAAATPGNYTGANLNVSRSSNWLALGKSRLSAKDTNSLVATTTLLTLCICSSIKSSNSTSCLENALGG